MQMAVSTGSDAEMLDVLGVRRDKMPEAIKMLQRVLERAVEKDGAAPVTGGGYSVPVAQNDPTATANGNGNERGRLGKMVWRFSLQPAPHSALKRTKTVTSGESGGSASTDQSTADGGGRKGKTPPFVKDTLDIEFMETGIDVLRRMSKGVEQIMSLPITR